MSLQAQGSSLSAAWRPPRTVALGAGLLIAAVVSLTSIQTSGLATSGGDPYSVPLVNDTNPNPTVVETTLVSDEATVDIGNGVTANVQAYNGTLPGPTFQLNVGDTVIVHYRNQLAHDSGIHWHGIELANSMDGTPFTQNQVAPGGSFLYKFTVHRPGIYWYHPHHHSSTNQVFQGLYGMILVKDPNEDALQAGGILPSDADTKPIVLTDITVCKAPGTNDVHAYDDNDDATPAATAPWAGGGGAANMLPHQPDPSPKNLCEGPAVLGDPYPVDEDGVLRGAFAAGDVPNIQTADHSGRTNEGQTVLTNGKNVGARSGAPLADQPGGPGAPAPGASLLDVRPGQGLRLQLLNASAVRYMRLRLTTPTGTLVPLRRVGGEGGLLDEAVTDGGTQGAWVTKFDSGEILLPPGTRAEVVAAIPSVPTTGVLTLWTRDYSRTGLGFSGIPTVPVMHLNLTGPTVTPAYTIPSGTDLRLATGDPVETLGAPTGSLLNPAAFNPAKTGASASTIKLEQTGAEARVDGFFGTHDVAGDYSDAPHLGSTRYATQGDTLELTVENTTAANHPFHLHGFSIQPLSLDGPPFGPGGGDFTWPYREFRDNVDVPAGYRLRYRVRLDPRAMPDETTQGGALGRWVFHCHIFFHATNGMLSEVVVVDPGGNERPNVNVNGDGVTVDQGDVATITGTYKDPDGDPVTLSASVGTVTDTGGGTWSWSYPTRGKLSRVVYITATDSTVLRGQIPFKLEINDKKPKIKDFKVKPKSFEPGKKSTPKKRGTGGGAKIRIKLSEASEVKFKVKGVGNSGFTRDLDPGKNKVAFTGRFKGEALDPGDYKLIARATDNAGLRSKKATAKFEIKRG